MSFDLFELDPVAEYLHLVIDSAEVVKGPGGVLKSQVSGAIPSASLDHGKASRGKFGILKVSARHLPPRHDQFPFLAVRQKVEIRVHNACPNAREWRSNGQCSAVPGDIWRIFKALRHAVR